MQTNPAPPVLSAIFALVACAALCVSPRAAHADSVYKCRGADGAIAFQDHACAAGAAESHVDIAAAPPAVPSPDYSLDARDAHRSARAAASPRGGARERREVVSYECRAANGELFYRHGACPGRISVDGSGSGSGKRGRANASATVAVTSRALPREEACRRIAAAGSIGRAGHAHDESVSTYDRNLGRDPCRYY